MAYDEVAIEAIKHALKALRKRHLLEEGAHAPALAALNRPLVLQDITIAYMSSGGSGI